MFDPSDLTILPTAPKPIMAIRGYCVPLEDSEPFTLIKPNMKTGPWIAGGTALLWYQGKPAGLHDIDVFCKNEQQARKIIDRLVRENNDKTHVLFESENAVTISLTCGGKSWKIQVIIKEFFNTVADVVDRFDITVCKIATDGFSWHKGPQQAADLRTRSLRMTHIKGDSIKRYSKYMAYGYRPVEGLYDDILAATDWSLEATVGEYDAF